MSRHIILGDVHLGKGTGIGKPGSGPNLNSRIQDQLNLLDWTLQQAVSHKAQSIIITGDVYEDPRPHPALIQFFLLWLKQCERSNIDVHIIAGNHDIVRTGSYTVSALDIIPAVEFPQARTYKDVTVVDYDGVSFTFLPFRDRRMYDLNSPEEALSKLQFELETVKFHPHSFKNNKKVLIGHLSLEGSIPIGDEIDDMLNEIFCPLSMFSKYDYVWMGHIHKPQVMSTSPHIAHIGSMDRSDFHESETTINKILIIFDSDSKTQPIKELVIPTRPLQKIEIAVPEDKDTTDFIINYLFIFNKANSLKDAIIKLDIQLAGPDAQSADRDKIYKYLYTNLNAHHVCNFSESRTIAIITGQSELLFDSSDISIPTAIRTFANNKIQEDKRDVFITAAMDCFRKWEQKYGGGGI